jgi:hypothetical protein
MTRFRFGPLSRRSGLGAASVHQFRLRPSRRAEGSHAPKSRLCSPHSVRAEFIEAFFVSEPFD